VLTTLWLIRNPHDGSELWADQEMLERAIIIDAGTIALAPEDVPADCVDVPNRWTIIREADPYSWG
jgi:hypothetical protein